MAEHYLETYSDPDLGTIAVIRDGKNGPIISTGADRPTTCHNHGDTPVAAQCAEHDAWVDWARCSPGWTDPSDR